MIVTDEPRPLAPYAVVMNDLAILIVGCQSALGVPLAQRLTHGRCRVQTAADGDEGVAALQREPFDVVLIAVDPAVEDPLETGRRLRAAGGEPVPLLLVAPTPCAVGAEGGDPVAADQFAVRLQALAAALARPGESAAGAILRFDGLRIDRLRHRVFCGEEELHLTPTEFRILWTLAENPGCVHTRQQLTNRCLGENAPVHERTIDVHVKSIRRKLGRCAFFVETVRGVGYRFHEVCAEASSNG